MIIKHKLVFALALAFLVGTLPLASDLAATDFDEVVKKVKEKHRDITIIGVDEVYQQLHGDGTAASSSVPASSTVIPEWVLILDTRQEEEYQVSHLQGAHLAEDITGALDILAGHSRDAKILVYCSLGYRSGKLARELRRQGYSNVVNMAGSLFHWVDNGYPVFQGEREVKKVHPYNSWWGRHLRKDYHSYTP